MAYVTAFVLLIVASRPAHAYLDPGSGSYMLQVTLAGILALLFALKPYVDRIKRGLSACIRFVFRPGAQRRA